LQVAALTYAFRLDTWCATSGRQMADDSTSSTVPATYAERALGAVARAAHERVGDKSGFDCVLCFLRYDQLVEMTDDYPGSIFATSDEHRRITSEYLADESVRERLISRVLEIGHSREGAPGALATRIMQRMALTLESPPQVRPLLYVIPTKEGIAVAVAIHDEFWTDEW
jgi:hypothetical protein